MFFCLDSIINLLNLCTNLRPQEIEIKFFIKHGDDLSLYTFVCVMLALVHFGAAYICTYHESSDKHNLGHSENWAVHNL